MIREDNIIIPRWFLEVVENTLQIQNNINLDGKTGETCQDRNIKQSLNGIRKLLRGEELTGGERLEKLQPPLQSALDDAAQKVEDYYDVGEEHGYLCCHRGDIKDAFKAGAEWMAGQGEVFDGFISIKGKRSLIVIEGSSQNSKYGDNIIVQIRKKQ